MKTVHRILHVPDGVQIHLFLVGLPNTSELCNINEEQEHATRENPSRKQLQFKEEPDFHGLIVVCPLMISIIKLMAIDLKHDQEDVHKHQRESLGPFNGDDKHLSLLQEMGNHIHNDGQHMYRKECVEYGLGSGEAIKESLMVIFMATLSVTVTSGSFFAMTG